MIAVEFNNMMVEMDLRVQSLAAMGAWTVGVRMMLRMSPMFLAEAVAPIAMEQFPENVPLDRKSGMEGLDSALVISFRCNGNFPRLAAKAFCMVEKSPHEQPDDRRAGEV